MKRTWKKRVAVLGIVIMGMACVPSQDGVGQSLFLNPVAVKATQSPNGIKQENQDKLNQTNEQINDLEGLQEQVEGDLDSAAAQMEEILAQQEELQQQMSQIQIEIEQAAVDLEAAQQAKEDGYQAMKLRIQYMYETSSTDSLWKAVTGAESFGEMLSRIEYVTEVYKTDRELMTSYESSIAEVEELTASLQAEMEQLASTQDSIAMQQEEIGVYMSALKQEQEKYATQLAQAQALADSYSAVIAEQDRILAQASAANNSSQTASGNTTQAPTGNTSAGGSYSTSSNPISVSQARLGSESYLRDASYNPAYTSGVSPEELCNFALQFVGYPYVWGGKGYPTTGVDCSGFVYQVYKHFGFTGVPSYSQSFKTYGRPVAYVNMQPGDIVVYPGHVAIYIGNGLIVEAQSTKAGITCNRLVSRPTTTITAIRRAL